MRDRLWRPLLALVCGIGMWAAFAPISWPFLAPFSILGLTYLVAKSRFWSATLWAGFAGLVFFGLLLDWIRVAGLDAWIALSIFCAGWILLTGAAMWCVVKLPGFPLWIGCIWVAQEALRGRYPWGGFPWGRLAFSQSEAPDVGYAAVAGAPLLTFVVAAVGALLAWPLITTAVRRKQIVVGAVCVACAFAIWLAPLAIPKPTNGETAHGPAQTTAALVQGSVPRTGLDAFGQRQAVLNNHIAETIALAAKVSAGKVARPDLVIWPENSTDIDPFTDSKTAEKLSATADLIGVPILIGAVTVNPNNPEQRWNVGVVWNPRTGPGQKYVKRHPVPFGEFVPFRSLLSPIIGRYSRVPNDFAAGTFSNVMQVGPARLGDVICFEIAEDQLVRSAVVDGGRAISVQTNNATFGGTAQLEQQAAMSKIRAVEHSRTVLVAATSGITMVVNPAGKITAQLPTSEAGSLVSAITLRDSLTVADRIGAWPEWVASIAAVIAIAIGLMGRRRSKRNENLS